MHGPLQPGLHPTPALPPTMHGGPCRHAHDRCRPAQLRAKGLKTLALYSLGTLMSLERIFLEAVMKAFQEMRDKVKSIGAATNLWLVCFYF